MNLRDLLVEQFKIVGKDTSGSYSLDYKMLEILKDRLLQCDEFKEMDTLSFTDSPIVYRKDGKIETKCYLLNTNVEFIGDECKITWNIKTCINKYIECNVDLDINGSETISVRIDQIANILFDLGVKDGWV